jgi:hypothetical protein
MLKKLVQLTAIAAVSLFATVSVHAASLSVVGGTTKTLPSSFDLGPTTGLTKNSTQVQVFDSIWFNGVNNTNGSNGLQLSSAPTKLRFEYLGSEAADNNSVGITQGSNNVLFNNKTSSVGQTADVTVNSAGAVPFYFQNNDKKICIFFCFPADATASNSDGITYLFPLSMAFFQENAGSVIALFGDGAGDSDFDDLAVRISVVPLPPAIALFGAALFGMGWLSRRRKVA